MSLGGIDGYTGVVAHMTVGARGVVEERGLAAVRVTYQCHVDRAALLHGLVVDVVILVTMVIGREPESSRLKGRVGRDYLDIVGLLMTETDLVAHQFVFHGILKGCIKEHLYFLALDESHLNDAFTDSTMALYLNNHTAFAGLQF